MYDRACEKLFDLFGDYIGDSLRVVATYGHEHVEPFYIRADLEEQADSTWFDMLHQPLWNIHRADILAGRVMPTFGDARGSYHVYDDLLLFQLPVNEDGGIYVSFDHGVGTDRPTLSQCHKIIVEAEGSTDNRAAGVQ